MTYLHIFIIGLLFVKEMPYFCRKIIGDMKKLIVILFTLVSFQSASQIVEPAKWSYSTNKISENIYELIFQVTIDEGWYMYGRDFEDGGPIKLSFTYEESDKYKLVGEISHSPNPKKHFDEIFQMNVTYFKGKATFRQKIEALAPGDFTVKGEIEYQACSDDRCIPFYPAFSFNVENAEIPAQKSEVPEKKEDASQPQTKKEEVAKKTQTITIKTFKVDSAGTQEENEQDTIQTAETNKKTAPSSVTIGDDQNTKQGLKEKTQDINLKGKSLWIFFWISFLAGLVAILTPCVFPMIPMTVSFFMHQSEKKAKSRFQAFVFGISIILIYTIIGTIVAVTLGANFANWLSTHWLPNVIFFLIFIIFAASFLGMFEIVLPSWMINKADSRAEKGGITGPFFMAFTLVLVSFSCTGPLVGAILVQSAGGEVIEPIIGMFGFSLAFALPFALFAFFPSLLSSLPKSGGWLNSVKVVLGFIELALGLKFLSIADQTYHWGILDREIYLALWIVIFTLMGFYLLGKLKFAHDSDLKHISVPRLFMAIVTFSFVIYLIPGMVGAPLKALSGYLPPQTTHDFDLHKIIRESASKVATEEDPTICDKPMFSEKLHLPHGLKGYFDYEQGMECARELGRPVFIDFTGHGCVNCREMESNVWSDPRVLKRLKEDYVIIALYVDDKTKLPEEEWIKSTYDGKWKKTIGRKYADFQISRFGVNAQPYYVLMNHKEEILIEPRAYSLDIEEFIEFLDKGIEAFNESQ